MARRRRSYGVLRHSPRKVMRAAIRHASRGWGAGSRKVRVEVTIQQTIGARAGRGRYHSFACVAHPGGAIGFSGRAKCSGYAKGSTPTKALKAALQKLARRVR